MDIVLLQTVTGQHILGKMTDEDQQIITLEGACMLVPQQQGQVGIAPMARSPKEAVPIYRTALLRPPFEAPQDLADLWRSTTSGIDLQTKPSRLNLVKP